MSNQDRQRWDEKYRRREHTSEDPSSVVVSLDEILPREGRALDVAGGSGRHAIWLAQRGLAVTLADISPVAISVAQQRAEALHVKLATVHMDLTQQPLPPGPWDLIVNVHYLWRPLFDQFPHQLALGGLLVFLQPTRSNLQRHAKPPEEYLLQDRELPSLVCGLEIIHFEEGWLDGGRHEALLVAKCSTLATP